MISNTKEFIIQWLAKANEDLLVVSKLTESKLLQLHQYVFIVNKL